MFNTITTLDILSCHCEDLANAFRIMKRLWAIIMTINYHVWLETKELILRASWLLNLSEAHFSGLRNADLIAPTA